MRKLIHVILLLTGIIGLWLMYTFWPNNEELPRLGNIESFTMPSISGEPYQLDNKKIKLVTFYYTNCPDICPLTMRYINVIQQELVKDDSFGEKVELVSITLDPEVDTKEVIQEYAANFQADSDGWKWLRGSKEKTKQVADHFQMMYEKSKDGFIAHNITVYLLDSTNTIRGIYDMATTNKPMDTDTILDDIKKLTD